MTDDWLAVLAGRGLAGAPPLEPPAASIATVIDRARPHRLVGLLAAAVAGGELVVDPEDEDRIAAAHEIAMREVLLLEEVLIDACDVLAAAGIDHRVVKGSALAHTLPAAPSTRGFGDNDVLVRADRIDEAVARLCAAGAVRARAPLAPDFDRRFAKSVTLGWRGATELDVHRTLTPGPFGLRVHLDDLWIPGEEFHLAGRSIPTLPATLHLVHGAIHVALGDVSPRLGNVRDVALLCGVVDETDEVLATAADWGCLAPLALGLRATTALGHQPTPIEQWARTHRATSGDERLLRAYRERSGRFRRQSLASMRVLGWRDRVDFARALVASQRRGRPDG